MTFGTGGTGSGGSVSSTGGMSGGQFGSGGSTAAIGGGATGGASTGDGTGGRSAVSGSGGMARSGTGGASGGMADAGSDAATAGGSDGGAGDDVKTAGCGATSWPTSKAGLTIDVSGTSRSYILRVPDDYDTNHPYRLILAFHWSERDRQKTSPTATVARRVRLSTASGTWPPVARFRRAAGNRKCVGGLRSLRHRRGTRPRVHARAAAQLENQLCIDKTRIFAEGFSMGGSMSYAVACAMGDIVRAVAVHRAAR